MTESEKSDRRPVGTSALGVAIAIGAVLLLAIGGYALRLHQSTWAWSAAMPRAPTFAAEWVEDVRACRLDEAYAGTTAAYRARVDRAAFGRWVADHPELEVTPEPRGWSTSSSTHAFSIGLNGVRMLDTPPRVAHKTGFRPAGEGAKVLTIVITAEGDRPLVDRAEIEPEPSAKP